MSREQFQIGPPIGFAKTPTLTELAAWFPMQVSNNNPRVVSLSALARVASEHGVKVLFYVWPLDLEYLIELGALDTGALENSRHVIMEAARKENVYFLDLSDFLGHEYFRDPYGHCKQEGQEKIARKLAEETLEILNGNMSLSKARAESLSSNFSPNSEAARPRFGW